MTVDSIARKYQPRKVTPKSDRVATSAMIASLAAEGYDTVDAPFGHALTALAKDRPEIVGLTADLSKYTDLHVFAKAYPDRFFQMGMAEQVMISAAAGLAREGFIPFATTYAVFASRRAYDFICMAIAEENLPVKIVCALPGLTTVRGRMELAALRENGAAVFVDYSHKPGALASALQSLRPHVMGRIVVVFGAGGDRDRLKRPLMGEAAREFADVVFVTDDNPRSEDPAAIRAEVMAGAGPDAIEVGDRAEAILRGVDALQPGDALLIAGKGHETGQIIGSDVYPFDDAEQASVAVAALDGKI